MVDAMAKKSSGNKVLRAIRGELGLSQPEFADEVDLSEIYLSNLENGRYKIGAEAGLKVYARFRNVFEVAGYSLEDLLRSGR